MSSGPSSHRSFDVNADPSSPSHALLSEVVNADPSSPRSSDDVNAGSSSARSSHLSSDYSCCLGHPSRLHLMMR